MELLKNEKTEKSTITLTVQVSKEEFETANNKAFAQNSKKLNVDGFRKGKVPRQIIEKMYGKEVFFDEAINLCYPQAFELAIKEAKIMPIAQPKVEVSQMDEKGIVFTIIAPVYPEMTLKSYKGLEVEEVKPAKVDAKSVNAEIENMAKKLSRIESVSRKAKKNDTVNFNFEGFVDGVAFAGGKADGFDLVLGSNQFIPGFEDQLIGVKAGQDLDVTVTFPETYHVEDLASKEAVFKCNINVVKETILPALDDEFAKDVSEFDTFADLKADITAKLKEKNQATADNRFEEATMVELVSNLEGEIPEAMIEQQLDRVVEDFSYRIQMQGVSLEDYLKMNDMEMKAFRSLFALQAEQQIKTQLALEVVVRQEKIDITEDDLKTEIEQIAKEYNMEVERVKEVVPESKLKSDILLVRAATFVRENTVATKPKKVKEEKAKDSE